MLANKTKLRSTFPIPQSRVRRRKWQLILRAPITWASYLPIFGAWLFLDYPPFVIAGLAALVAGGIALYWKTRHDKVETKLLETLIAESNEAQDQHLIENARSLHRDGFTDYATSLASFIEQKQKIERALHTDGEPVSAEKRDIETLVDSILFGVSDQIQKLAELDRTMQNPARPLRESEASSLKTARDEISARIHEAWDILEETRSGLGNLINPSEDITGENVLPSELKHAIEKLRQEHHIASRVKERMETEWREVFETESD